MRDVSVDLDDILASRLRDWLIEDAKYAIEVTENGIIYINRLGADLKPDYGNNTVFILHRGE